MKRRPSVHFELELSEGEFASSMCGVKIESS